MHTVWLSREEVTAYGRDFLNRLLEPKDELPEVWCAITISGLDLAKYVFLPLLAEIDDSYSKQVEFWCVGRERGSDNVVHFDAENGKIGDFGGLEGRRVLIFDSAIHSGDTFTHVHQRIAAAKPSQIVTYSLVVKKSSAFYPTYWGCSVEDADRAYFLLNAIPNNRLTTGSGNRDRRMNWSMRRMKGDDCDHALIESGLASIDRITWHERYYAMQTNEHSLATYLCEVGSDIAGFVTFHLGAKRTLVIDEIAVSRLFQKRGLGGVLLRFAETFARQTNSQAIRFWAVLEQVPWYQGHGYEIAHSEPQVKCDSEVFQPMVKKGLYRTFFHPPE